MDVLNPASGITPQEWQIRTNVEADGRAADRAPARFGRAAKLSNSLISAGSDIQGTVINSVLAPGVVVEKGALVKDSILFADCIVRKDAVVDLAILDKRVWVKEGAVIGQDGNREIINRIAPSHLYSGITLIGKEAVIPPKTRVGRNCVIDCEVEEAMLPTDGLKDGESILMDE